MRRLDTDKKLICIQMIRLETDEKVGHRLRRLDTVEKIAIQMQS